MTTFDKQSEMRGLFNAATIALLIGAPGAAVIAHSPAHTSGSVAFGEPGDPREPAPVVPVGN